MISPISEPQVAVVGLGYVGLPLAVEFGKRRSVIGYDLSIERIEDLKAGSDRTREFSESELKEAHLLKLTCNAQDLNSATFFIVAVPTPVDAHNRPDLTPLISASGTVGNALKRGDIVVFESTVYPGATEEVCVPVLEQKSGLAFNVDFFVGYSPERINPGDRTHRLSNVVKITSASTTEALDVVDKTYNEIVAVGTHRAQSIKVAEAAKVIENTQRDLNIALINELAILFNRMGIDTEAVLSAAATKWNFLNFRPGLVGGHCIGVDPYYLTYKAEEIGYHPQIILAGRRLNDGMGAYVANQLVREMIRRDIPVSGSRILVMGLTFKENVADIRNTRVVDIVRELTELRCLVDVYDPWVAPSEASEEYGIELIDRPSSGQYDAIVIAVAHAVFREMGAEKIAALARQRHVIYDLKYVFPANTTDLRL